MTRAVPRWTLAALILLALVARLPGMAPDLTDHDSWRQTDTATIARNFLTEPRLLHPRINWGAPGPGYVESELQLYPFAVHLIYRAVGENPLYGRILSLILVGIAALVMNRLARRYFGPWAAFLATAFFLASPVVFRYSRAFMPEATVLLFTLVAVERYLRFLDTARWSHVLVAAAAMALAILVKPTSIHVGLVLILLTLSRRGQWGRLYRKGIAFAAIALIPAAAYYAHAAGLHLTYGNTFGALSGGDSKWGGPEYWARPGFYLDLLRMERDHVFGGTGGFVLVLLGVSLSPPTLRPLLISWFAVILLYYLIVARYAGHFRGLQYHEYAAIPAALAVVAGLRVLLRYRWPGIAVGIVLASTVAAGDVSMNRRLIQQRADASLAAAGRELARLSEPEDFVLVMSSDVARDPSTGVPNNFEQPDLFFHANRKGRSIARDDLTGAKLTAALDFRPKWFVAFTALRQQQDPGFSQAIQERMRLAASGTGFEIYEVVSPSPRVRETRGELPARAATP